MLSERLADFLLSCGFSLEIVGSILILGCFSIFLGAWASILQMKDRGEKAWPIKIGVLFGGFFVIFQGLFHLLKAWNFFT